MTANANTIEPPEAMADRYYAMAESMNSRGAMELAVPFYRQAVALLLAERESLQAQLGRSSAPPATGSLPVDELHGLLEAAEALQQQPSHGQASVDNPSSSEGVEAQIAELAEELNRSNALQVMAGLRSIASGQGLQLPISGLMLLGKSQMLLGKSSDALKSFETALTQAPERADLIVNTGAARLATGDADGAAELLRGLRAKGMGGMEPSTWQALLRNLATIEQKLGRIGDALELRLEWLEHDPEAAPLTKQLQWARQGLEAGAVAPALTLLRRLHEQAPNERSVMQLLADALEQQGDYREASLLYRELLRPATEA